MPSAVACTGLSPRKASNASPTTPKTSPKTWSTSAKPRTSAIPAPKRPENGKPFLLIIVIIIVIEKPENRGGERGRPETLRFRLNRQPAIENKSQPPHVGSHFLIERLGFAF